jgi:signal transduction histidine kinase
LFIPPYLYAQRTSYPKPQIKPIAWELRESQLQLGSLDSLETLLKNTRQDSNKVDVLNAIAFIQQASSTQKSLERAQEALQIAHKLDYKFGIHKSSWLISYAYFLKADYEQSLQYGKESIAIAQKINYSAGVSRNYRNFALLYERQNKYDKSLEYYFASLKINEENQNHAQISQDYFRIALSYEKQENLNKALDYMRSSLEYGEKTNDNLLIIRGLNWIGYLLRKQKKYTEALKSLHQSLKIAQNKPQLKRSTDYAFTLFALGTTFAEQVKPNAQDTSQSYYALKYLQESIQMQTKRQPEPRLETILTIAQVYEKIGKPAQALNYFEKALASATRQNAETEIWRAKNHLAAFYNRQKQPAKALQNAQEALQNAQKIRNLQYQQDSYLEIALAYAELRDFAKAYQYQVLYKQLNDSLRNNANAQRIARMEVTYEFEKKQKIAEIEQQKLLLEQKNQAHFQMLLRNGFMLAFGVVLGLAFFVFILYAQQRRTNALLAKETEENERKSRQIQSHKEILEKAYLKARQTNEKLRLVNNELQEKREEVEQQTEELREANLRLLANQAEIQAINTNLEAIVKERTENLQKSYSEITQLNTELDNFLYHSSHSLRRPLTTILGLNQLAKIILSDAQAQDLFDKVEFTAQNMDKMLHKFLMVHDINELEEDELMLIDFEDLLSDIEADFCIELNENNIYWQVEIQNNIQFQSYRHLLKYIFVNLIENSIFFCNEKNPILKIDVTQTDQKICLKITDNGEGIVPELQNRIFEMFFRANEKSQGNGLGLYVVKKAIERLNGSIRFQSEPNLITEFEILLPLQTSKSASMS